MFLDGDDEYPNSCVVFCWFPTFALREMFGYLREKEDVLQRDARRYRGTTHGAMTWARLQEVQDHLAWMTANIRSIRRPPPRDRSGSKKGASNQLSLWEGTNNEQTTP